MQGESMSESTPVIGQKVYYIDHRGTQGVLTATVQSLGDDGSVELSVQDINASGGSFIVMASLHGEDGKPGTWYLPK